MWGFQRQTASPRHIGLIQRPDKLASRFILTVYEGLFVRINRLGNQPKTLRLAQVVQIMLNKIKVFTRSEQGATATEYALIAAGISLAITVSVFFFGQQIYTLLYEDLPNVLDI